MKSIWQIPEAPKEGQKRGEKSPNRGRENVTRTITERGGIAPDLLAPMRRDRDFLVLDTAAAAAAAVGCCSSSVAASQMVKDYECLITKQTQPGMDSANL